MHLSNNRRKHTNRNSFKDRLTYDRITEWKQKIEKKRTQQKGLKIDPSFPLLFSILISLRHKR